MSPLPSEASLSPQSPTRVFALVLLVVFAVEGAIMLLLPQLPPTWHGTLADSLLDASLLSIGMAPVLWVLVVLPLRRLLEARGRLLHRLFDAQEQERARLARDLHDGLGQDLTALLVGLRTIEDAGDLATAGARARALRELAAAAHGEARRLARGLRPLLLEELGLVAALDRLREDFARAHSVTTTLESEVLPSGRLEPAVEFAAYRIAQEALANAARHAGARRVELRLRVAGGALHLSVHDDGRGFDAGSLAAAAAGPDGFGLASMRERARMLGGDCTVRSRSGEGTTVMARIPLP